MILTRDAVYGVRDPWGLRPLALGELEDGGFCLASESCAFATIGARMVREIGAGEVVRLDAEGLRDHQGAPPRQPAFCTFEQIYFARPDSVLAGRPGAPTRQALGRQLAREAPQPAPTWSSPCPTRARPTPSATPRRPASPSPRA